MGLLEMIRVERLELKFAVRISSGASTTILLRARDGDIEWDPGSQTVRLPIEGHPLIPADNILMMTPMRAEMMCPECMLLDRQTGFADPRALGAHRRQKHQVAGKRTERKT